MMAGMGLCSMASELSEFRWIFSGTTVTDFLSGAGLTCTAERAGFLDLGAVFAVSGFLFLTEDPGRGFLLGVTVFFAGA
jgi:hypothetical protein